MFIFLQTLGLRSGRASGRRWKIAFVHLVQKRRRGILSRIFQFAMGARAG
jgi:hypothetical protein